MKSKKSQLTDVRVEVTGGHCCLQFREPVEILSSAVLNGGPVMANNILNMKVPENFRGLKKEFPSPSETLELYAKQWTGTTVGMMTAALMKSYRVTCVAEGDVIVECHLTSGVSNARRAGDPVEHRSFQPEPGTPGTINIILGTSACLTSAAMVEALMIVTEAKAAVLQEKEVLSPVSGKTATGTGTDAAAIFNGRGREVHYCGKHTLMGEMIAGAVTDALTRSLIY